MTADQPLLLERRNAVAIISINDPSSNRTTLEFMDRLEQVIEGLASDDSLRSLVFTAEGVDSFSVGMDLKQLPEGVKQKGSADAPFDQRLKVISRIEQNLNMRRDGQEEG